MCTNNDLFKALNIASVFGYENAGMLIVNYVGQSGETYKIAQSGFWLGSDRIYFITTVHFIHNEYVGDVEFQHKLWKKLASKNIVRKEGCLVSNAGRGHFPEDEGEYIPSIIA